MTQPATPDEVKALRQAQAKEYGQYVAVVPIDIRGARAFNVGDPVPVSHVENGVVGSDQVSTVQDQPAGNASLSDWQDYARTKGATDEDLAAKTRDELRDLYSEKG